MIIRVPIWESPLSDVSLYTLNFQQSGGWLTEWQLANRVAAG